jgi:hypothetical protein
VKGMGQLHPKVKEFKEFVEKHPKLIDHVRKNKESWQTYYDKWRLYGEEDAFWKEFKSENNEKKGTKFNFANQELVNKLTGILSNIDLNKLQEQMAQLNGVLTNVQSIIEQFKQNNPSNIFSRQHPNHHKNPFWFGKD